MSMSSSVVGFKPPDAKFKEMLAIWKACEKANVDPPQAVVDFFNDEDPDPSGVMVDIEKLPAVSEYSDEMQEGFEVDIRKLPPDIKIIRFWNSF